MAAIGARFAQRCAIAAARVARGRDGQRQPCDEPIEGLVPQPQQAEQRQQGRGGGAGSVLCGVHGARHRARVSASGAEATMSPATMHSGRTQSARSARSAPAPGRAGIPGRTQRDAMVNRPASRANGGSSRLGMTRLPLSDWTAWRH